MSTLSERWKVCTTLTGSEYHQRLRAFEGPGLLYATTMARHVELGAVMLHNWRNQWSQEEAHQHFLGEPLVWRDRDDGLSMIQTRKELSAVLIEKLQDRGWRYSHLSHDCAGQVWTRDGVSSVRFFYEDRLYPQWVQPRRDRRHWDETQTPRDLLTKERRSLDMYDTLLRDLWGSST